MEKKKMSIKAIKGIVCSILTLIVVALTITSCSGSDFNSIVIKRIEHSFVT